jgi:hypothetical protein
MTDATRALCFQQEIFWIVELVVRQIVNVMMSVRTRVTLRMGALHLVLAKLHLQTLLS